MEFAGKRYRIKSNGRFIIFVTVVLILAIALVNGLLGLGQARGLTVDEFTEVTVQAGDTLWNLAQTYAGNAGDLRNVVDVICDVNHLDGALIYPGQVLLVPIS